MAQNQQQVTAFDIKEHYEELKAKLLNSSFDLGIQAQQADVGIPGNVRSQLTQKELKSAWSAAVANKYQELRDGLRAEYVEKDIELRAALEARAEVIEDALRPQNVSLSDWIVAADASIDALKVAFGAASDDVQKMVLAVARERNNEELMAFVTTHREDFADLMAELAVIEDEPSFPPDESFEQFANPAPTKQDILGGRIADIDQTAALG
jgi:hypothetical protein